ncbi:MAG TPA: hypothetical protein VGL39_13360 [Jatrophihabitantaceae bacterium]|jgi:hypothetical protein
MTLTGAAQALFISSLQPSERPTAEQIVSAVEASLRQHGGVAGCACLCAAEYGDHPDIAPDRMRWALSAAAQAEPFAHAA